MSRVEEIKAAIDQLSPGERQRQRTATAMLRTFNR